MESFRQDAFDETSHTNMTEEELYLLVTCRSWMADHPGATVDDLLAHLNTPPYLNEAQLGKLIAELLRADVKELEEPTAAGQQDEEIGDDEYDEIVPFSSMTKSRPKDLSVFSEVQRELITQHCEKPPREVRKILESEGFVLSAVQLSKLRHTVGSARTTRLCQEDNGYWTENEIKMVTDNRDKAPTEIHALLLSEVPGFAKNAAQVSALKTRILVRLRRYEREGGNAFKEVGDKAQVTAPGSITSR